LLVGGLTVLMADVDGLTVLMADVDGLTVLMADVDGLTVLMAEVGGFTVLMTEGLFVGGLTVLTDEPLPVPEADGVAGPVELVVVVWPRILSNGAVLIVAAVNMYLLDTYSILL